MAVSRHVGAVVVAVGLAVTGTVRAETLRPGETVSLSLKQGDVRSFSVGARQGEYVAVDVEQDGADVVSTTSAPDGTLLLETDSPCGPKGPDPVAFVAPADGAYAIALTVRSAPADGAGLRVRLDAVREPSDADLLRAETVAVHARAALLVADDDRRRESLPHLRAALEGWRSVGDARLTMWTGMMLGNVLDGVFGERQQAAAAFEEPLALARALGDEWAEARISYNRAQAIRRMGLTQEARALFGRSIELHRSAGRLKDLSNAQRSLSDLMRSAGEEEAAAGLARDALESAEASGDANMTDRAYLNVAQGFLRSSEPEEALALLDRPFPGFARDRQGRAVVSATRANAYGVLGDDDRAYEAWLDTIDDYQTIGNRGAVAEAMLRLSDVHRHRAEWDEAVELIDAALAVYSETGDRLTRAAGECRMGEARLGLGQVDRARDAFAAAIGLAGEGAAATRICGVAGLGKAALAAGDLDRAQAEAERALALVEADRAALSSTSSRTGALARSAPAFELLTDVRMRQHARWPQAGHAAEALAVAEAGRARSLVELLSDGRIESPAELGPRARPLDVEGIRRETLDEDTLLLEFALGDRASYLWVVGQDELSAYALPARAVIERAARPVRDGLASAPEAADAAGGEAARSLAALLLGPAAARLGSKRLLVVAPGILQYLPFGALPDPRDAAGAPLLARHEVVQAPSASTVAAIRRARRDRPAAPEWIAVLADPVYERADPRVARAAREAAPTRLAAARTRGAGLARLPFSRAEAVAIERTAGRGRARLELGFDASRANALGDTLSRYRFIHFAAHGLVDGAQPARSGIVLSQFDRAGRPQDGGLRLRDVYGLRLSADLVVLSGCQTALGRDVRGEGLVGLASGFLFAGARQVVASLWRVDDLATAELMTRFYRALLQEGRPPAAALRQAQLEMSADRRWRDPYFWAGFVLQGDWR